VIAHVCISIKSITRAYIQRNAVESRLRNVGHSQSIIDIESSVDYRKVCVGKLAMQLNREQTRAISI
jgi:hypothetical protein